jgi:glycosyltransferase involved in cell wall biosynthesis
VILTYTEEALSGIPQRHRHKARPIVHVGVTEDDVVTVDEDAQPGAVFSVLSGGRLVHWKGFDLLIEGFAGFLRSAERDAELVLTGDGPYRSELETLVRRQGIGDKVRFVGWLPRRADVYRRLATAHVYALPTLRDGPPTAILEAMAAGKPVLCLDVGATREMVPDFAAIKIAVDSRERIVSGIAEALTWAESHRPELREMGEKGRAHALDVHHWHRIGDELDAIYRSIDG